MKYESPKLTTLMSATNAIQSGGTKSHTTPYDSQTEQFEMPSAYVDWED
jgi:hypothetical protein